VRLPTLPRPPIPEPDGLSRLLSRIAEIKAAFRRPETQPSASAAFSRALAGVQPSRRAAVPAAIETAAGRHGLDPDLLLALAEVESGLRPDAVSPRGALGITQLMPATASRLGLADPFNIEGNVDAGARFLKENLDRFGGDTLLALAAYNAGPGAVQKYGGVPPYAETRAFITRVLDRRAALRQAALAKQRTSTSDR